MAKFAFRLLSGGVGPANITNSYIAFTPSNNCDTQRRLYQWYNYFNYTSALGLGYSMSMVDGGQHLPNIDSSGRPLPTALNGKNLRIEVSGGHYPLYTTKTNVKLTLAGYDKYARKITLYEDTFNMKIRGTNIAGINVEGKLKEVDLGGLLNDGVYTGIMHPSSWRNPHK